MLYNINRRERCIMLDSVLSETAPPQVLLDLVTANQGVVTQAQLQAAGYPLAQVRRLCREHVLTRDGAGRYRLANELGCFDGRVLLQWAVPGGILAARTALIYHELSLALPREADVCVPADWSGEVPLGFRVHVLRLPPDLRDYGVMTVYPDPPGTVRVAMYSPAVAVAQVLSDEYYSQELQDEALWMYRQRYPEGDLEAALRRYHVTFLHAPAMLPA